MIVEDPRRPSGRGPPARRGSVLGLVVLVAALAAGYWLWRHGAEQQAGGERAYLTPHASARAQAQAAPATALRLGGEARPAGSRVEWDEAERAKVAYLIDGLQLTLFGRESKDGRIPVLQVRSADGKTIVVPGGVGFEKAAAAVSVVRADPASLLPQVLFTYFSGGAHCCVTAILVEQLDGKWRATTIADGIDGDSVDPPKDLAGDGSRQFQLIDNQFLYAFTSYAASYAPPVLIG